MHSTRAYTSEYLNLLHWNDVATSIYLLGFLSYVYFTNNFMQFGSFERVYIVAILAATEIVKFVICVTQSKVSAHKSSFKDFLKNVLAIALLFVIIYIVAVLFGAPVFSSVEETSTFALLVTSLTALPMCMHLGGETTINMFLSLTSFDADPIYKLFMLKLRLTLFGAWLGAIVIPLDWNRPWQKWPIPCCIGTMIGYTLASCACSIIQTKYYRKFFKKTGKYRL